MNEDYSTISLLTCSHERLSLLASTDLVASALVEKILPMSAAP